jgi:hypothetical protein
VEFGSLGALARHAATVSLEIDAALAHGVRDAGKVILKRTKAKFGEYHDAEGPFQTWPELQQSTQDERVREGYTADDPLLRSGNLRDSYRMEAEGLTVEVGSEEDVALYQEVGVPSRNLPARSTLGMAFVESEKDAFDGLAGRVGAVLSYGSDKFVLSSDLTELEEVT